MNNSPFEIFRRNLKPLMVLLTGLALFAFVVLPVVDSYMRQNSGSGGNRPIAKYDGRELTQNRVEYFTRNHHETVGFLTKLAKATFDRGGVPSTPGFQYDPRSGQILRLGINQNPGADVTVRSLMFAGEAKKSGFELDDNAIRVWLDRFTDGTVSDSDITGMLMAATQNRMGRPHLYEQLRTHLLADVYQRRGYAGLYANDNPSLGALMTPAEQWAAFLKLNRSATADAYGILVNDYLDQTDENPPEDLIADTYDKGKDRDPNDLSPEPAFHQPYTASFEFLEADLKTFIDKEVAKLKEEEIRAEYDKRVAGGAFQLPDEDPQDALAEPEGDPTEGDSEEPGADSKDSENEDTAEQAESTEATADQAPGEESDEEMPADPVTEAAATTESGEAEATEGEKPAAEEAASEPEGNEPKEDETKEDETEEESPDGDQQGAIVKQESLRLVALQQEGDQESGESETDEPEADEPETPAEESGDEDSEQPDQSKSTDVADPESATESDSEADAEDKPAAADEQDGEKDADKSDDEPKPAKVQSFKDVRDQIANELAFPAARQQMTEASAKIFSKMRDYFTQKTIYDNDVEFGQGGDEPTKPDLQALADEYGFEFKAIGPYDRISIADEPISTSMDAQTPFGSRGPNFTLMMYGYGFDQSSMEPQAPYAPLQTTEFMSGKNYISWKTAETEAYTPTLAEARDQVVTYLRMREAKELAQDAAEELVKQAAEQSDRPLVDLIPPDKKENYHQGLGPFKWMDSFGSGVTMGNVPELDAVGDDFMAAVFDGEVDGYRIAANQPERVIYIVKPTKFEPSPDELRQQFREPANRRSITAIDPGVSNVLNDFYQSIEEKAGFIDLTVSEQ